MGGRVGQLIKGNHEHVLSSLIPVRWKIAINFEKPHFRVSPTARSVAHYTSGIWGQGVRNFGFRGNLTRKHSLEYWAQFDERGTCPGDNYDFAESIKRPNY
ncbi:uncharacterized protein LOC127288245 [Leptopilina boulardi]|uniref:uncharacterized protein LOC127288245 n=1 Tax=Leptopilina boulardi TaxID=63433 RepID=UPI0021F50098|nr:uncharacterized protein LOC127288245 [Leptopilina boulardi]